MKILRFFRRVAAAAAAMLCNPVTTEVAIAATSWTGTDYVYSAPQGNEFGIAVLRVFVIIGLGVLGFAIGWFLSPHGRKYRKAILTGLAVLAGLIILFNGSAFSWSIAWMAGYLAFIAGFGYWTRGVLKELAEPPTTFGSAKWADAEHLYEHELFDPKPIKQPPIKPPATSGMGLPVSPLTATQTDPFAKGQVPDFLKPDARQSNFALPSATPKALPAKKPKPGLRLGFAFDGEKDRPFYYRGEGHLLTVAPTRSGKGTTQIVPNLLTYQGSVLVIDPKGENAKITARARAKMGQDVRIVDPWGIAVTGKQTPARFNPLDWLKAGDVDITENAMLLADALVVPTEKGDRFWDEEAKALVQGIILYVATDPEEAGQRHLGRVRDLLLLDGNELREMFNAMVESPHHVVASTGARSLQKDDRLLANVLASAQAQTHFLDSARVRENLSASDFDFADLKTKLMTVYLVLPSDRLNAFSRWLRLLVQQAITVNARNIEVKPKQPVLFLLDEMPALGRLSMIEQAYGLMAGFGMQLWGIVQDLGQLKRIYGDGWETFIGNSGVVQYFGSHDCMTAEYFSKLCGVTTVWNLQSAIAKAVSKSVGNSGASSSQSSTETDTNSATQRKLAYPDELMRLPRTKQLVLIEKMNPIRAIRKPWFQNPALKSKGVDLHKA
ncbi:MAG: type IV secretory system conjugative DNA transfer family protein [Rhodobacter sp.]|nr:type IV secretory system conjugative DNA transfer family protein [Rhodobacter sp.]